MDRLAFALKVKYSPPPLPSGWAMDKRWTARLYRRFLHKYFLNDLGFELQLDAKREALAYLRAQMASAMMARDRFELLRFAVRQIRHQGLVLEFGVEKGASLTTLANAYKGEVHGFDSFRGLPEDWTGTYEERGKFSMGGRLPKVPDNAKLHVGWFDKTLPEFLATTPDDVALLHVDCDIYSSTKTIFEGLGPRIKPGTVIVFDEYFNYPAWRHHEYKAFQEFVAAGNRRYSYIGFSSEKGHVAVRME
jgi:predicted O-methyltransferase YrrM